MREEHGVLQMIDIENGDVFARDKPGVGCGVFDSFKTVIAYQTVSVDVRWWGV